MDESGREPGGDSNHPARPRNEEGQDVVAEQENRDLDEEENQDDLDEEENRDDLDEEEGQDDVQILDGDHYSNSNLLVDEVGDVEMSEEIPPPHISASINEPCPDQVAQSIQSSQLRHVNDILTNDEAPLIIWERSPSPPATLPISNTPSPIATTEPICDTPSPTSISNSPILSPSPRAAIESAPTPSISNSPILTPLTTPSLSPSPPPQSQRSPIDSGPSAAIPGPSGPSAAIVPATNLSRRDVLLESPESSPSPLGSPHRRIKSSRSLSQFLADESDNSSDTRPVPRPNYRSNFEADDEEARRTFDCRHCHVKLHDLVSIESHLRGKPHLRQIQRLRDNENCLNNRDNDPRSSHTNSFDFNPARSSIQFVANPSSNRSPVRSSLNSSRYRGSSLRNRHRTLCRTDTTQPVIRLEGTNSSPTTSSLLSQFLDEDIEDSPIPPVENAKENIPSIPSPSTDLDRDINSIPTNNSAEPSRDSDAELTDDDILLNSESSQMRRSPARDEFLRELRLLPRERDLQLINLDSEPEDINENSNRQLENPINQDDTSFLRSLRSPSPEIISRRSPVRICQQALRNNLYEEMRTLERTLEENRDRRRLANEEVRRISNQNREKKRNALERRIRNGLDETQRALNSNRKRRVERFKLANAQSGGDASESGSALQSSNSRVNSTPFFTESSSDSDSNNDNLVASGSPNLIQVEQNYERQNGLFEDLAREVAVDGISPPVSAVSSHNSSPFLRLRSVGEINRANPHSSALSPIRASMAATETRHLSWADSWRHGAASQGAALEPRRTISPAPRISTASSDDSQEVIPSMYSPVALDQAPTQPSLQYRPRSSQIISRYDYRNAPQSSTDQVGNNGPYILGRNAPAQSSENFDDPTLHRRFANSDRSSDRMSPVNLNLSHPAGRTSPVLLPYGVSSLRRMSSAPTPRRSVEEVMQEDFPDTQEDFLPPCRLRKWSAKRPRIAQEDEVILGHRAIGNDAEEVGDEADFVPQGRNIGNQHRVGIRVVSNLSHLNPDEVNINTASEASNTNAENLRSVNTNSGCLPLSRASRPRTMSNTSRRSSSPVEIELSRASRTRTMSNTSRRSSSPVEIELSRASRQRTMSNTSSRSSSPVEIERPPPLTALSSRSMAVSEGSNVAVSYRDRQEARLVFPCPGSRLSQSQPRNQELEIRPVEEPVMSIRLSPDTRPVEETRSNVLRAPTRDWSSVEETGTSSVGETNPAEGNLPISVRAHFRPLRQTNPAQGTMPISSRARFRDTTPSSPTRLWAPSSRAYPTYAHFPSGADSLRTQYGYTTPTDRQPEQIVDAGAINGSYEADLAEAIKRSLEDFTPRENTEEFEEMEENGSNDVEEEALEAATESTREASPVGGLEQNNQQPSSPRPGCSHWSGGDGDVSSTSKPSGPNWQDKYNHLLAKHLKLISDLQSSVECPICMEIPRSAPIPCCINGHVMCLTCWSRSQQCPTCRRDLPPSERCVSHVANRLVDLLPHPCTNRDTGCQFEDAVNLLGPHERDCEHRLIKCPSFRCKKQVSMKKLGEHISTAKVPPHSKWSKVQDHPLRAVRHGTTIQSFDPVRFVFEGRQCFLQSIASEDKAYIFHFVQMCGTREECEGFTARIEVIGKGGISSLQSCRVTPLDLHCLDDLHLIGDRLVILDRVFLNMVDWKQHREHSELQCRVQPGSTNLTLLGTMEGPVPPLRQTNRQYEFKINVTITR